MRPLIVLLLLTAGCASEVEPAGSRSIAVLSVMDFGEGSPWTWETVLHIARAEDGTSVATLEANPNCHWNADVEGLIGHGWCSFYDPMAPDEVTGGMLVGDQLTLTGMLHSGMPFTLTTEPRAP